jgi:hypothetical protein
VRAVAAVLLALVATGLVVFLRRYRGGDRTAVVLCLLSAVGLCLTVALVWFQHKLGGTAAPAGRVRGAGAFAGLVAGLCTAEVGAVLLAVRWAIDQQTSPAAERFASAFVRALASLASSLAPGLPAYLAVGGVAGVLVGLAVAEIVIGCAVPAERASRPAPERLPSSTSPLPS